MRRPPPRRRGSTRARRRRCSACRWRSRTTSTSPASATLHGTTLDRAPATADSEVIARLRRAGAVILGKTNMPELALWAHFTETPANGITRNPWDLERTPCGSSGGSAAAVAAGLAAVALASDGGASIRVPAGGVWAVRHQAAARPRAAQPGRRSLARAHALRPGGAHGRGRRAVHGRGCRPGARWRTRAGTRWQRASRTGRCGSRCPRSRCSSCG